MSETYESRTTNDSMPQQLSSFSDGEIYLKIVEAKTFGLEKDIQLWQQRLPPPKQGYVERLLRNDGISGAFNELRDFPGLWKGLELGNIPGLLALHCDEASRAHYLLLLEANLSEGNNPLSPTYQVCLG